MNKPIFAGMTIDEARKGLYHKLKQLYPSGEAGKMTDLVFENLTGYTPTVCIVKKNDLLSISQEDKLDKMNLALLQHAPLQYVLKEAWFCNMPFYVNEKVLIPRPETEELVDWVLKFVAETGMSNGILDAGTGSGCIAIALKKKIPSLSVYAFDKYQTALEVAKRNAVGLGTDVRFLQADLLERDTWEVIPPVDILVSNPPYIPTKDREEMPENVIEYEPGTALFVPDHDPLVFYKKILELSGEKLPPGGAVFVEIYEGLGAEVKNLFEKKFKQVVLKKDLSGKDRMVSGIRR